MWATVDDTIDNSATSSNTGKTATSSWVTDFSIDGSSGATYFIHTMGTKNTSNAIQWNANGYLYATKSGGTLKSITVTGTNSKSIKVYASNTAYNDAPSGTALATMNLTGSAVTYTFTDSYKYIALKGNASSTSITSIVISYEDPTKVATPEFSEDEGTYYNNQSVTLSCKTGGSTIRYTTNGDTPTSSSTVYSSAITVDRTMTIKAKAFKDGLDDSDEASATYTLKCTTPSISKAEGYFVTTKEITMTSSEGATIYYTTNGDAPTSSSTEYDPSNKPVIDATTTFKAIAIKDGWTNSDVAEQTITKETVLDGLSELVANTNTSDATYYVNLTNAQVTYVNGNNGYMEDTNAGIYIYSIKPTKNKVYNGIFRITYQLYNQMPELKGITAVEGTITDGSDITPTVMTASDLKDNFADNLGRQIKIVNHTTATTTVLITGVNFYTTYYNPSFVKDNTYTIVGYPYNNNGTLQYRVISAVAKPSAPEVDFAAGEFSEAFTLHLSCETDGAAIYYTTDGTEPTTSSNLYSEGIAIPAATTTVKAISYLEGMSTAMDAATYTYKAVAKPYFSPVTGTAVYYGTKVAVSCATEGADIFYTLTEDESTPADPTSASTAYPDGGIVINANTVKIKVIAKKGDDYSSVAEATYTLKDPAAPTFSPAAGAVARNTVVTISSAEGTTIYYTTDGTDPNDADDSGVNSVNVTITDDMTIRAICIDGAANISSEASADYTIAQVVKPTISKAAGMLVKGTQVEISTTTDGATIYYTLDGTTPSVSSTVYTGYVVINSACTLKAVAIKENYIDSEVASIDYTVEGSSESFVFSGLGYSSGDDVDDVDGTDVKITFSKGDGSNNPKYYTDGSAVRIYSKNTINIKSTTKTITAIVFTFSSTTYNTLSLQSGESGSFTDASKAIRTWTGTDDDISFIYSPTSGQSRIQKIEVFYELTDDNATIGTSKLAGYCSGYKLDFSGTGLTAYKAKVEGNKVKLTAVADGIVPAGEGVILNGDAAEYDIPISTADVTTDFSDNEMVGVTQRTQVLWNPSDGVYNYILQNGEFNKATTGYLKPNRAYLSTSYDVTAAGARELQIVFEDETTGINSIENSQSSIENCFDLQGRKVTRPTKGLYIVNGKKVIIK